MNIVGSVVAIIAYRLKHQTMIYIDSNFELRDLRFPSATDVRAISALGDTYKW